MIDLNAQLFETIMLICFGSSWPFAVVKTLRTKVVSSKSIVFLFLILCGYLSGVIHKLIGNFDHVIWLYMINGSMVFTEIILYFRYRTQVNCARENRTRLNHNHIRYVRVDDTNRVLENNV